MQIWTNDGVTITYEFDLSGRMYVRETGEAEISLPAETLKKFFGETGNSSTRATPQLHTIQVVMPPDYTEVLLYDDLIKNWSIGRWNPGINKWDIIWSSEQFSLSAFPYWMYLPDFDDLEIANE